jgi:hypothetical protein
MEKLTRKSEVEYKGTIYTGMVIVERSIDEWKEKNEAVNKAAQLMGFAKTC